MREALPGGWLVATNLNNILKKPSQTRRDCDASGANVIKLAAEVAGLSFGKDVIVEFWLLMNVFCGQHKGAHCRTPRNPILRLLA